MQNPANENQEIIAQVPAELEELVPWFLGNIKKNMETIRLALVRGELETARIIGHDMKGVGASYGFEGISDIGWAMEHAAIEKDVGKIDKSLEDLREYIEKVKIIVKDD